MIRKISLLNAQQYLKLTSTIITIPQPLTSTGVYIHHLFLRSTSAPSASVFFGCFVQQLLPYGQGDPDYDSDAESPITDSFCQTRGSDEIIRIINFTPADLCQLYVNQHTHVASFKNMCHYSGSSILIVILTLMNNGGSWHALAYIFSNEKSCINLPHHWFHAKTVPVCR